MAEDDREDSAWEAGFEGDRAIVVSRLGFGVRLFPRPRHYVRRFFHEVHELPIEEWSLPIPARALLPGCFVETFVDLRFQPTFRYASQDPARLPNLGAHIRANFLTLLTDIVEEELKSLENPVWLTEGCVRIERRIVNAIQETLALRDIQSRAQCLVKVDLEGLTRASFDAPTEDVRYRALRNELLRRRNELIEQEKQQQLELEQRERERELLAEQEALELARREAELRRAVRERELDELKAEIAAEEQRQAEQRLSEARQREEQLRTEAHLRDLEREIDLQDQDRRSRMVEDTEDRLKREIELLALERQRLILEEEIRDIKIAKAKGWVINAKRRFSLGRGRDPDQGSETDIDDPERKDE
ncbi:MAG: hypothetical protein FJ189_13835 [Gammaproteobacteria bacterium]|nr:hypothetical protein [Gammaproteobacteria bacterium]